MRLQDFDAHPLDGTNLKGNAKCGRIAAEEQHAGEGVDRIVSARELDPDNRTGCGRRAANARRRKMLARERGACLFF